MPLIAIKPFELKGTRYSFGHTCDDAHTWPEAPMLLRSKHLALIPDGEKEKYLAALSRGASPSTIARSYGPEYSAKRASRTILHGVPVEIVVLEEPLEVEAPQKIAPKKAAPKKVAPKKAAPDAAKLLARLKVKKALDK